jgi:hypothetical protein
MSSRPRQKSAPESPAARLALAGIVIGSGYLLLSAGAALYHPRHRPSPADTAASPSGRSLEACWNDLMSLVDAHEEQIRRSARLVGRYDGDAIQSWSVQQAEWRERWHSVGRRCRWDDSDGRPGLTFKEERVLRAYRELWDHAEQCDLRIMKYARAGSGAWFVLSRDLESLGAEFNR